MPISKQSGHIWDFAHEGCNLQSKIADTEKMLIFHTILNKVDKNPF